MFCVGLSYGNRPRHTTGERRASWHALFYSFQCCASPTQDLGGIPLTITTAKMIRAVAIYGASTICLGALCRLPALHYTPVTTFVLPTDTCPKSCSKSETGLCPNTLFRSLCSWSSHPAGPPLPALSSPDLGGRALSSGIGIHGLLPPRVTHTCLICSSLPRPCTAPSRMKSCSGPCESWGCVVRELGCGEGAAWRG